ncbi:MAG: SUMF1/EgtB/PvdO family nonheme iron enzyme [Sedimentisphaerales bacterium]
MKTKSILVAVLMCVMAAVNFASADTIRGINMDFVTIGNAGNAGDTRTGTDSIGYPLANPYGCGAVGYNYRIGKYEVTNAQWNAFTAAAGAPTGNPSYAYDESAYYTGAQQPTNMVSWCEAAQFCNYLTSGDKSKGAYLFSGDNTNPGDFLGINRNAAVSSYGIAYVIPTEDEWYKAAYYKPDGSGYSLYANGTDTAPIAGVQSNYNNINGAPWNVGTGTMEQNGTFDMMGNVFEWNETLVGSNRSIRGGSYLRFTGLTSSYAFYDGPTYYEIYVVGFRVASIPEPASAILIGAGFFFARLRRRQS